MGKGGGVGDRVVGSCLRRNDGQGRRNDGRGRRNDGRWGAGMTELLRWCRVAGVKHAARQLTAAQRARRAAAALARSGGGGA